MASISICTSWQDWKGKVSFFHDEIVYLRLEQPEEGTDISITINPVQAKILGEILVNASLQAKINEDSRLLYGDLTIDLDIGEMGIEEDTEEENILNMDEMKIDDETWPEVYNVIRAAA